MSESTLSITYADLQEEVGSFLHYGADVSNWSAEEFKQVDRLIQSGIRQFYYPPATEGVELGYRWSFLTPTSTLVTVADDYDYDLPDDYGSMNGQLQFETDTTYIRGIVQVSVGKLLELRQDEDDTNEPRYFATRSKNSDGSSGQRHEILFWPTPDAAYTLTYRYDAYAGKLIPDTFPYPLGGMKFAECITESCLAVAEKRGNDEDGFHGQEFQRLLAAAVSLDRRNGAQRFGQMGGGEDNALPPYRQCLNGTITYKGDSW